MPTGDYVWYKKVHNRLLHIPRGFTNKTKGQKANHRLTIIDKSNISWINNHYQWTLMDHSIVERTSYNLHLSIHSILWQWCYHTHCFKPKVPWKNRTYRVRLTLRSWSHSSRHIETSAHSNSSTRKTSFLNLYLSLLLKTYCPRWNHQYLYSILRGRNKINN